MDLLLIDVVLRMEIIEISLTMRSASIVDLIMLIYDKYIYIYMGMGQNPLPFSLSAEAIARKAESIARTLKRI